MADVWSIRQEMDASEPYTDPRWARLVPFIDMRAWGDCEPPPREWMLDEWVPRGQTTYLTGKGAGGKSLLAQQLCTCVAMGIPFLGVPTRQAKALYLTCEDRPDELWRRQLAICRALGLELASVVDRLELVSLMGQISTELGVFDEGRRIEDDFGSRREPPGMRPTERYTALEGLAIAKEVGFVALDNTGLLFAGNENIRNEVASFVALCNRLATRISGGVLLIGHPNKAGDSFSGSTAWENHVRSRIFLDLVRTDAGDVIDADQRVLKREKANYASNSAELTFRWRQWSYVRNADLPEDERASLQDAVRNRNDEALFLACLRELTRQKRALSEKRSPSFAPSVCEKMPESKGIGKRRLEEAMWALWRSDRIEKAELWKGPDRKPVFGLRETLRETHAGNAGDNQ